MRLAGITAGVLVGILISIVIFRFANTDKKIKTSYDERQEAIRNLAYKYAFYTVLFYECVMLIFGIAGVELPIPDYAVHFLGIILGSTVLGVYCVYRDAFWGLNNSPKRYFISFAIILILNIIPVAGAAATGTLISDGQLMSPVINIMVILMLFVMLISFIVKRLVSTDPENMEDEA